jgi:hypothetical protein
MEVIVLRVLFCVIQLLEEQAQVASLVIAFLVFKVLKLRCNFAVLLYRQYYQHFLLESDKWSRFEHLNEHCSTMLSLVQNQTALGL